MAWSIIFNADWTGSNGDPWPSADWNTDTRGDSLVDIQNNNGRLLADGGFFDYATAVVDREPFERPFRASGSVTPETTEWSPLHLAMLGSGSLHSNRFRYTDVYLVRLRFGQNDVRLSSYVSDSSNHFGSESFSFSQNTLYHWEFEALGPGDNNVVRFRIWADGSSVPGWLISSENTDHQSGAVRLTANMDGGTQEWSHSAFEIETEGGDPPPDAPENVSVSQVGTDAQLTWDSVTDADSYVVQRRVVS